MKFGKITSAMALTMAVATVPAFALNTRTTRTSNGQYQTQSRQDVFARFDTNGDGVISRSEWPRDAATFDRLDLNRDGVITRAEAQQAFQNRQRNGGYEQEEGQRFRGMDRNGDGVITRDEWRGNDRSFARHDRNGDGILSGDELRGNGRSMQKRDRDDEMEKHGHGNGKMKQNRGKGHERD